MQTHKCGEQPHPIQNNNNNNNKKMVWRGLMHPLLGSPDGEEANFMESWNHRIVWVGKNLKDHLVPTPQPWTGTSH